MSVDVSEQSRVGRAADLCPECNNIVRFDDIGERVCESCGLVLEGPNFAYTNSTAVIKARFENEGSQYVPTGQRANRDLAKTMNKWEWRLFNAGVLETDDFDRIGLGSNIDWRINRVPPPPSHKRGKGIHHTKPANEKAAKERIRKKTIEEWKAEWLERVVFSVFGDSDKLVAHQLTKQTINKVREARGQAKIPKDIPKLKPNKYFTDKGIFTFIEKKENPPGPHRKGGRKKSR